MKIQIYEIGNDLKEKNLALREVETVEQIKGQILSIAWQLRKYGLWKEDKPIGYLKTEQSNIGAKIVWMD